MKRSGSSTASAYPSARTLSERSKSLQKVTPGCPTIIEPDTDPCTVNGSTQFEADADVTLPASLNFASTADLTVGQKVEVDLIRTVDCVLEAPTALAEEVELNKQAIEARVQAVGASTITIPGSGLLDGASITIQVSGETELDDIENLASLAVNTKIRAKGLLLKDASGDLIILAEEVKDRT